MTGEEAQTVARIAMTADNGCSYCASELLRRLRHAFPDTRDDLNAVWVAEGYEDGTWEKL